MKTINYSLNNFIIRLKNAFLHNKKVVEVPYTKLNLKILNIFLFQGCIDSFYIEKNCCFVKIIIQLKYKDNESFIKNIKLISKPGLRVRFSIKKMSLFFNKDIFQGFYLISTSQGLFTNNEFLNCYVWNQNIKGGEILLKVVL